MTLSFEGETPDDLIDALAEMSKATRTKVRKIMIKGGEDILKASIQMTPVKEGDLEAAQHLDVVTDDGNVLSLEIVVGGVGLGRDVDDYATILHEGQYNLGPASQAKNDSNPSDRPVGPKFLERAVELYEDKIMAAVEAAMPGD